MIASVGQLATGHSSAVMLAGHQPVKLAAFEGIYRTGPDQDLTVLGWVDEQEQQVRGIRVPGLLSILVGGSSGTVVKGLNEVPAGDRPPVQAVFQFYHLMVAIGMTLIGLSWLGGLLAWRGTLFRVRALQWILVFAVLLPQISNQLGWAAAEVGRQPWIVSGLMRTSDGVSDTVGAGSVLLSLILFTLIYLALLVVFLVLLDQKIRKGPLAEDLGIGEDV